MSSKGLTSPTPATLAQPYVEVMSEIEREMVGVSRIICVGFHHDRRLRRDS